MKTIQSTSLLALSVVSMALIIAPRANGQYVTIIRNTQVERLAESQVELVSPEGLRILIDVADPDSLTKPPTEQDILLSTHLHRDHFNKVFADSFPGKQIRMEEGEIDLPKLHIKSIVASHSTAIPSKEVGGDNFIFIIDLAGLRIIHFGDLEQTELSASQVAALADVDVAFGMVYYPQIVDIINIVKPHILIPTHIWGSPKFKFLMQQWPALRTHQNWLKLTKNSLPMETSLLFIGDWGERIGSIYKLPYFEME